MRNKGTIKMSEEDGLAGHKEVGLAVEKEVGLAVEKEAAAVEGI